MIPQDAPGYSQTRWVACWVMLGAVLLLATAAFLNRVDSVSEAVSRGVGDRLHPIWHWAIVAVPCFIAGLFFRIKVLQVIRSNTSHAEAAGHSLASIQTWLNLSYVLFCGPSIMNGALYLNYPD